jgi:arsenate reductase
MEAAMTHPFRGHDVLFLCRDNAVLGPMAEALLNHWGRGRFRAVSAGWTPAIGVHAAAVRVLRRAQLLPAGLRPRHWTEVQPAGGAAFRFVVIVGRELPERVVPWFDGDPVLARWQVDAPSTSGTTPERQDRDFERALRELEARVKLFASLPLESLDRLTMERQLAEIDLATTPAG